MNEICRIFYFFIIYRMKKFLFVLIIEILKLEEYIERFYIDGSLVFYKYLSSILFYR